MKWDEWANDVKYLYKIEGIYEEWREAWEMTKTKWGDVKEASGLGNKPPSLHKHIAAPNILGVGPLQLENLGPPGLPGGSLSCEAGCLISYWGLLSVNLHACSSSPSS